MVAAAGEALGQVAAGALGVAGTEAGLEERVVEDVPLRARAPELDEAGPQRLDPGDARPGVALPERVNPLDEREQDGAPETGGILWAPRAHPVELRLRRRPVA